MPHGAEKEPLNPKELRRRAVERLEGRRGEVAEMPADDVEKPVRELEVYLQSYRDLFDAAPVGYLTLNHQDRVIRVNRAALDLCSREREELEGKDLEGILVPEDREKLWRLLRRAASTGQLQSSEFRIYRPGRASRYVHADVSLLDPAFGAGNGFRLTLTDITGRIRAEDALRHSEQRLSALVHASSEALYQMSPDWSKMRLLRGEEFLGDIQRPRRNWLEHYIFPEDRPGVTAVIKEAIRSKGVFELEHRVRRKDGSVGWAFSRAVPLLNERGEIVEWFGAAKDITARKQAEEALQQSEAHLSQAIRVARLGTFDHDHRSDTIAHSAIMREMLGFGEHERITLEKVLERVLPEDRETLERAIQAAHDPAGNGVFEIEYRIRSTGGGVRWLSARSETFFEGKGPARHPVRTIGAALDVTERKELLETLTQAKERLRGHAEELEKTVQERTETLQRTVQELEHFSYTITHDMRAPLRAMQGFGDILLMQHSDRLAPEGKEFVRRIIRSADRMDKLITDALNYSKVLAGDSPLHPVDAKALLESMVESYPQLQPPNAEISIDDPLPLVLGNQAGLTQVFSNLLTNAVKFVPPERRPRVRVWAEPRQPYVRLWFEDNGIGIPRQYKEVIWEMFQKLDKQAEGTGVGLALVKKVMERMKGNAGVESQPGKGSRFWVELQPAVDLQAHATAQ